MLGQQKEDKDLNSTSSSPSSGGLPRKTYWRSVSWSERSPSNPNPRPNSSSKARSCLPPLQPLSIARRCAEEWPKAGSDDLGEWPNHPPTPGARPGASNPNGNSDSGRPPLREFQLKKDKLAFFDKECSRIADHIYLGSEAVAKNREVLRRNGITHVLNCVGFVCPEYFKSDLVYKTLWLQDSPSEDITSILYDVFDYFEDVREHGGRVLVHCCQGISRSTSLVIAYLMWRDGQSFEDAFQYVKAARGVTNPNMGFACQLLQCQKRVHAMPVSPTSVLRMYRMAPHSPHDALHLVPKMLNCPSPLGLDSRGAFIIHVPSAIYVWIGKHCNPVMTNYARTSASQVVRYERANGPIVIIQEGKETLDFWDALGSGPLPVDNNDKGRKTGESVSSVGTRSTRKDLVQDAINLGVGNKKVAEYDADFEIFFKALSGGVVPPFPLSETGFESCLPAREHGWGRLRQKLASGVMKELVTAAKLTCENSQTINAPDKIVNTPKEEEPSIPSPDPVLSPSPPCGSPDSFSCYTNTSPKSNSKSPSPSPSQSDNSSLFTFSPASSNWSDSSQSSPSSIEHRQPFPAKPASQTEKVCFPCKNSSPCKDYFPSLAVRRGSNPPTLKLFTSSNDPPRGSKKMAKSWSFSFPTSEEDRVKNIGSYDFECEDFEELIKREISLGPNLFTADEEVKFEKINENELDKFHVASNDLINKAIDLTHPVLFQWPNIEKVDMLHAGVLDSKSVFLMLSPDVNLGKENHKILYIWVGRDAQFEKGHRQSVCSESHDSKSDDRHIYWEQVGRNFLNQMGLPMDTPVQMVCEGVEPEQFLNHFSIHQLLS